MLKFSVFTHHLSFIIQRTSFITCKLSHTSSLHSSMADCHIPYVRPSQLWHSSPLLTPLETNSGMFSPRTHFQTSRHVLGFPLIILHFGYPLLYLHSISTVPPSHVFCYAKDKSSTRGDGLNGQVKGRCSRRDATSFEMTRQYWEDSRFQGKTWTRQDTLYCVE